MRVVEGSLFIVVGVVLVLPVEFVVQSRLFAAAVVVVIINRYSADNS